MVTDPFAGHRQQTLQEQLHQQWRAPAAPAQPAGAWPGRDAEGPRRHGEGRDDRGRTAGGRLGPRRPGRPGRGTATAGVTGSHRAPTDPAGDRPAIRADAGARVRAGLEVRHRAGDGSQPARARARPRRGNGPPGKRGNFVVAAHDYGRQPFLHLRRCATRQGVCLHPQPAIRVRRSSPSGSCDTQGRRGVPGARPPGLAPHRARITLITCTPVTLEFTPWRIVVTGELVRCRPGIRKQIRMGSGADDGVYIPGRVRRAGRRAARPQQMVA